MNERQYLELCQLTDQILMAPDATSARTAIPLLHVIREHPAFLEKYEKLFLPEKHVFVFFIMSAEIRS